MTDFLWRLLAALDRHHDAGTIEVCLEFEYAPADASPAAVRRAWAQTQFVVAGGVGTLVRKGLACVDAGSYGITPRGRDLLQHRAARRSAGNAGATRR